MPSIGELNIRIGAQITGLVKNLNTAERRLQRSASRFSRIGNELSLSVSLPLLAIGKQAISTAADFDRFEQALNTITGSAAQTSKLLKELEKDARAPGVELDGLVKGIVRLSNTGQSIEEARRAMNAFGNAIALAGGTASDLDGVSLALTQIISKGKISAEEINQLGERVPQIRKAIQDAFGTADSEELQKAGVSVEQFVDLVTSELEKLPKAQSGLANALNNTGQVIRRNFANLGKDLDQTFDITGNLEKFADRLTQLTDTFTSLGAGTKRFVLTTGLLVAGIGPAIKLFSLFKTAQLATISTFKSLVVGAKNTSGAILVLTQRFAALNAVSKASVIGLAAAAIAGAIALWKRYEKTVEDATAAQRAIQEVQSQAATDVARQKVEVDRLINVIKEETSTQREKGEALKELQRISPEYFANINTERALIEQVTSASDKYLEALTRRARATAAQNKLVEIEAQLLDTATLLEQAEPTFLQKAANFLGSIGQRGLYASLQAQDLNKNLAEQKKVLEAQRDAMLQVIKETDSYTQATNAAAVATARQRAASTGGSAAGRDDIIIPTIPSGSDRFFFDQKTLDNVSLLNEKYFELNKTVAATTTGISGQDTIFQNLSSQFEIAAAKATIFGDQQTLLSEQIRLTTDAINQALEEGFTPTSNVVQTLTEQLTGFKDELNEIAEGPLVGIKEIVKGAEGAIVSLAASGETSFRKLGKSALAGAASVARAKLIEATVSYVADSFAKFGIFGALLAAGAGVVVGGLFNRVLGSLRIPALAQGGLAYGPQLAIVGDNPNARFDPEVIAPLSKLQTYVNGSGDGQLVGEVVIRGSDMALLIRRQARDQNRF